MMVTNNNNYHHGQTLLFSWIDGIKFFTDKGSVETWGYPHGFVYLVPIMHLMNKEKTIGIKIDNNVSYNHLVNGNVK